MGALNQADRREGLSAKIRFASANSISSLAVCIRRPRYRVFRYPNCPFMTANTCSTLALTDDFSCSLLLICPLERLDLFLYCDGLRLIWYLIFLPCLFMSLLYHFFVNFSTYLLCAVSPKYYTSTITLPSFIFIFVPYRFDNLCNLSINEKSFAGFGIPLTFISVSSNCNSTGINSK